MLPPVQQGPSFETAHATAINALDDVKSAIQEGRRLFCLDSSPPTKLRHHCIDFIAEWRYYFGWLLVMVGFTCIRPPRRRNVRTTSKNPISKPTNLAQSLSVLRLQKKHQDAAQSQAFIRPNRWRIALIHLGPFMFFLGPNLVTIGSAGLHGASKEVVIATGSVLTAWPIFSTLLKKSKIFDLRSDIETSTEAAIKDHNLQAADELGFMSAWNWAGYLVADIANIVIGSWASFRRNKAYGIGNAVPDLIGICILLPICINLADRIGAAQFPHDVDGVFGRFGDFISDNETVRTERRKRVQEDLNDEAFHFNVLTLTYALASLIVHVVLILYNPIGRKNESYIYDAAIPSIINFIAAIYLTARLMQQMFPNYLLAHIRAEWGAHLWRTELESKMGTCIDRLNMLEDAVDNIDLQYNIVQATEKLRLIRDRLWLLTLCDHFPHRQTPRTKDNSPPPTECTELTRSFTSLRENLSTISSDLTNHETNRSLNLTKPGTLFKLSNLSHEPDNYAIFDRIEEYYQSLTDAVAVHSTLNEMDRRIAILDQQIRSLDLATQAYHSHLTAQISTIRLPNPSERHACMATISDFGAPPSTHHPLRLNSSPTSFGTSIAHNMRTLAEKLDEVARLQQELDDSLLNSLTDAMQAGAHQSIGAVDENQQKPQTDPDVIQQERHAAEIRAALNDKKTESVQWLQSWLGQSSRTLWPEDAQ